MSWQHCTVHSVLHSVLNCALDGLPFAYAPTASGVSLPAGLPRAASLVPDAPTATITSLLEGVLIGAADCGSEVTGDLESSTSCSQLGVKRIYSYI